MSSSAHVDAIFIKHSCIARPCYTNTRKVTARKCAKYVIFETKKQKQFNEKSLHCSNDKFVFKFNSSKHSLNIKTVTRENLTYIHTQ